MKRSLDEMAPYEEAIWRWFEKNAGVVKNRAIGSGSDACLHREACTWNPVEPHKRAARSICAYAHPNVPDMFTHGRACGWKHGSKNGYPQQLPEFSNTFSWVGTDCFDPTPSLEAYLQCSCGDVNALLAVNLTKTIGEVISAVIAEGEELGPPLPEARVATVLIEQSGLANSVFVPLTCGHQRARINVPDTFSDEPVAKRCNWCRTRYSIELMNNHTHARITREPAKEKKGP